MLKFLGDLGAISAFFTSETDEGCTKLDEEIL